jgi:hypothetical protein
MKSFISFFILGFLALTGQSSFCNEKFFSRAICNPSLKITDKCYNCHNLVTNKDRCIPVFKNIDITEFLSDKKWKCDIYNPTNNLINESDDKSSLNNEIINQVNIESDNKIKLNPCDNIKECSDEEISNNCYICQSLEFNNVLCVSEDMKNKIENKFSNKYICLLHTNN